jgi:hypothetical protein
MPEGVQYPDIIDKVIQDKDGSVVLVMCEERPWDGSEERLAQLRKKINTYVTYARQGQLTSDFPDLAGKPVLFQLWCIQHRPDPNLMQFLDRTNALLAKHSLQIRVLVVEVTSPEMIREERRREGKPWWKIW